MGFGLLFIGYFISFLMSLNNYGFAFEIVGFAIMLSAVGKLSEYKHGLSRVSVALLVMALCSVYDGFRQLNTVFALHLSLFNTSVAFTFSLVSAIATVAFHILLLIPIRDIAKDAQDIGLAQKAFPAIGASVLAFVLELTVAILGSFFSGIAPTQAFRAVTLISVLVHIFYPVIILWFIYSCYAKICAPEDVEMPQRPSRFAFINNMREKRAEKEAEVQKARRELLRKSEKKATASKNQKEER